MAISSNTLGGRNQLQWVVLLLAVAVLLPTVSLLWFISRVVTNERLVVRQKLVDVYQGQLDQLARRIDQVWAERLQRVDELVDSGDSAMRIFETLAGAGRAAPPRTCCASIIYDSKGNLLYPLETDDDYQATVPEQFTQAWDIEFNRQDFAAAAEYYGQLADYYRNNYIGIAASMAQIRCLRKAGDISRAAELCRNVAYGADTNGLGASSLSLIAQARVLLVSLKSENRTLSADDLSRLIDSAANYDDAASPAFLPLSSQTRVFLLDKAISLVQGSPFASRFESQAQRASRLLAAEQLTVSVGERLPRRMLFGPLSKDSAVELVGSLRRILQAVEDSNWPERLRVDTSAARELLAAAQVAASDTLSASHVAGFDRLNRLPGEGDVFAVFHKTADKVLVLLQTPDALRSDFAQIEKELSKLGLHYRVLDASGKFVCGLDSSKEPGFLKARLGQFLPGWQIELLSAPTGVFEKAADKQIAVYIWTGLLVIALILLSGGVAVQVVGRQIRLNRMKNDFIATVSHELKTPLASMRVLVDTLLEGNIKDPKHVEEYLRLTARENERLSRMIDNFLTFSRMERNKKAFTIVPTSPAAIAADAAEAVKTKFAAGNCQFAVDVADTLPEIPADHDAMVTVLVNLLDNAWKYTDDDKQIMLKVFAEDAAVCFAVSDNGVGLARRHIRKIFDSFYQVDRTLARRAEGCGLGLSIVKFIVGAHKGTISVDGKLGKGSTFTVKIPV